MICFPPLLPELKGDESCKHFSSVLLFALQPSANTGAASLPHRLDKPGARDAFVLRSSLQAEQANTRGEGGVIIVPSVTREHLWSGKTIL